MADASDLFQGALPHIVRPEDVARAIDVVRFGLSEAKVMADIANYKGDRPPFTSGYDDVHDACNAIWLAAQAVETIARLHATALQIAVAETVEIAAATAGAYAPATDAEAAIRSHFAALVGSFLAATSGGNSTFLATWFAGTSLLLGIVALVAAVVCVARFAYLASTADEHEIDEATRLENMRARQQAITQEDKRAL